MAIGRMTARKLRFTLQRVATAIAEHGSDLVGFARGCLR